MVFKKIIFQNTYVELETQKPKLSAKHVFTVREWFSMVFKKIIFQNTYVELQTPPPLHGKIHLRFPFWLFDLILISLIYRFCLTIPILYFFFPSYKCLNSKSTLLQPINLVGNWISDFPSPLIYFHFGGLLLALKGALIAITTYIPPPAPHFFLDHNSPQ